MKKLFGWIFAVLSLLLLAVFVTFLVLYCKGAEWGLDEAFVNETCVMVSGMSVIPMLGCGFASHLLMIFAEEKGFPYYVTFPMYGIVLAFYYIVMWIKFIFLKLMGTDTTFEDVCLNIAPKSYNGETRNGGSSDKSAATYTVTENGFKRTLTLFRSYCQDYETPSTEGFGAYYNKFKDDLGNYWRSYDGNKTFISESALRKSGWKISW